MFILLPFFYQYFYHLSEVKLLPLLRRSQFFSGPGVGKNIVVGIVCLTVIESGIVIFEGILTRLILERSVEAGEAKPSLMKVLQASFLGNFYSFSLGAWFYLCNFFFYFRGGNKPFLHFLNKVLGG